MEVTRAYNLPPLFSASDLMGGTVMKNVDQQTLNCLQSEKQQLMDDVRRCDLCSTNMEEHSRCYEEAARESGVRSKSCFV
jgi:hypothetical protein